MFNVSHNTQQNLRKWKIELIYNGIREQRNHVLNISIAICQVQLNLDQFENVLCNHHVIKLKIRSTETIITKTTT